MLDPNPSQDHDMNESRPVELMTTDLRVCALYLHAAADTANHRDTSERVARALRSLAVGMDRLHQAALDETAALNARLDDA